MRDSKGKFIKGHTENIGKTWNVREGYHGNLTSFKTGVSTWNKGKPMSEEAKQKMIKSKLGKTPWNKGKKETRIDVLGKQSKSHVGKRPSTETSGHEHSSTTNTRNT